MPQIYDINNQPNASKYTPGEIIVSDSGILRYKPVYGTTGNVYTFEVIMPKEIFVEAYKKYILNENSDGSVDK